MQIGTALCVIKAMALSYGPSLGPGRTIKKHPLTGEAKLVPVVNHCALRWNGKTIGLLKRLHYRSGDLYEASFPSGERFVSGNRQALMEHVLDYLELDVEGEPSTPATTRALAVAC